MRVRNLLFATALLALASVAASAQGWSDRDRDDDRYRNAQWGYGNQANNNAAYQQGWNDAMDDARHNRATSSRVDRYHNNTDRAAYDQGYRDGRQAYVNQQNGNVYGYPNGGNPDGNVYGNNGRHRGWGRGRGNQNRGVYGGNGYPNGGYGNGNYGYNNGMQVAEQNGYNDGLREGSEDRRTGHSFRPTEDDGYRRATNGYRDEFGSKDQYKQWYRQSYERGYRQGYNNNGGGYGGWRF